MKGPSGAFVVALAVASSHTALAHADPRYDVDRFSASERGSEWFANESLDLRGRLRPSLGYVVVLSHRVVVVGDRAPVRDLTYLHAGGSLVLADRLRLAFDLPFQVYAGGETAGAVPAPPKEGGIGDLRLGADVRLFGEHGQVITGAVGIQAWAPTGQRTQWASDGVFRMRPRAMLSGEIGVFVWAAQVGAFARRDSELTLSAAAGVRLAKAIVVGPEIFAEVAIDDAFARTATPVEALLGGHWLVDGTARVGIGVGRGLTVGVGSPAWRAILGIEWAPAIVTPRRRGPGLPSDHGLRREPDQDNDGIPDSLDACPQVVGIATSDPKTNGCPPDADGDGIDDLADACPTLPGIATSDPETNGCPDRDRDKDGIPNDLDACPDDRGAPDIDPHRNGCPKAFVRGSRIELLDPIAFKPGTADPVVSEENESVLTGLLRAVLVLPEGRKLRIEGHTDNRGELGASRKLGAARAVFVAKWLVEHGIDAARITSEGVGADRPITTNETEAGRTQNRRLEFHLD